MPTYKTIYDKDTGEKLIRTSITAAEAVQNDPKRFRFTPWPKVSERDAKKAEAAAKKAAKPEPEKEPGPVDAAAEDPAAEDAEI